MLIVTISASITSKECIVSINIKKKTSVDVEQFYIGTRVTGVIPVTSAVEVSLLNQGNTFLIRMSRAWIFSFHLASMWTLIYEKIE